MPSMKYMTSLRMTLKLFSVLLSSRTVNLPSMSKQNCSKQIGVFRTCYQISLRKEGYNQKAIDHLFKAIFLPKLTHGLPVYGASTLDLNAV